MIRLMTLNLNGHGERHGPWSERRPRIAAAVAMTRPDIIALQAVARDPRRDDGLDQAVQLARDVGDDYTVHYHPTACRPDGSEDGIAVLSRRPVADVRALPLSRRDVGDDPSPRAVLHVTFTGLAGPWHLLAAHFSWVAEQASDNVGEALAHLDRLGGPVVLAGDLNQTPDSVALARLRAAGLTDAWAALHPDVPGFTFYERGALRKRIDYVLLGPALAARLRGATLVLDEPGQRRASDHAGLVVDLDGPA